MTSQAQASEPLAGVQGLMFLGFPLHAAGKPTTERAAHLSDVQIPMLFLQGEKDKLAESALLQPIIDALGRKATLMWVPRCGSFVSCSKAQRPQRHGGYGLVARCLRRLGRCNLRELKPPQAIPICESRDQDQRPSLKIIDERAR